MIGSFGKLARSSSDTRIICNVDLQKCRLPAFPRNLSRRFATGVPVPSAEENLKSLSRELTRHLIANPFIRAGNQCRIHVWRCDIALIGESVVILAWQQVPQHWLRIRR